MTSQELAMLERAFAEKLVGDGLLEVVEMQMGGHPPLLVRGYALTHAGRYQYCARCEPDAT